MRDRNSVKTVRPCGKIGVSPIVFSARNQTHFVFRIELMIDLERRAVAAPIGGAVAGVGAPNPSIAGRVESIADGEIVRLGHGGIEFLHQTTRIGTGTKLIVRED